MIRAYINATTKAVTRAVIPAINSPYSAMYEDGELFDNAKVCIQFDDAWASVYDNSSLFDTYNIKPTTWVNGDLVGTTNLNGFDYCTWDELKTLIGKGWDVQCHGYHGFMLDTITLEQVAAEYTNNNAAFLANGLSLPKHTCYSATKYTDAALKIVDDYRLTGRCGTANGDLITRKTSKFEMPTVVFPQNVANIKKALDNAKRLNRALCLNGHMLGVTDSLSISLADMTEIIEYAINIGVDFVTVSELYRLMYAVDIRVGRESLPDNQIDIVVNRHGGEPSVLERSTDKINWTVIKSFAFRETDYSDTGLTENTNYYYRARLASKTHYSRIANIATNYVMTLAATGNGTGIATLKIMPWDSMTVQLTGGAKFYTDAGGTVNESTELSLTRDTETIIYIRCASGTSNIVFPSNKISRINNYIASTNAPSLGGDVSGLTYLNYLRIDGNNTLSGSISDLVDLTYLNVAGSNTLTGDISNLALLTDLFVVGSNTLTGSINNLTNLNTYMVMGTNTITGDITNCPGMVYLRVLGSGAIGGDVTTIKGLVYLQGNTLCTFSGDIGGSGIDAVVNGITTIDLPACRLTEYTQGATWSLTDTSTINPSLGYGFSATDIDNIIIDMAASLGTVTAKTITLKGSSAARTAASNDAVTTLNGKGWTVVTN